MYMQISIFTTFLTPFLLKPQNSEDKYKCSSPFSLTLLLPSLHKLTAPPKGTTPASADTSQGTLTCQAAPQQA